MKQKGIVLLITLMFIASISLLILKNLDDSEKFFKIVNTDSSLVQTKSLITNTNQQIMKFFKDKSDNLDDILEQIPSTIPLQLSPNIKVILHISEFYDADYININDINQTKNDVDFIKYVDFKYVYFDILNKYLKQYKHISNHRQIEYILNQYINETRDTRILKLQNKLIGYKIQNNQQQRYIQCDYVVIVNNISSQSKIIFEVGKLKYKYYKFSFRNIDG